MMLRVSLSSAAASANQPAAAGSAAHVSVTMVAPRPFGTTCRVAAKGKEVLSGVVFQPFEELKGELSLMPQKPDQSLTRHKYIDECEAAINQQINVEFNASFAYHSLFTYFDGDNLALKGFANSTSAIGLNNNGYQISRAKVI